MRLGLACLAMCLGARTSLAADPGVVFHAADLRQGRFTYELTLKGKPLGRATIEIRREVSGDFRISFDSDDVKQRWSSTLGPRFTPVAAELEIGNRVPPYVMSIRYFDATVSGTESDGSSTRAVAAALHGQVVDQRVDWAAMMAARFPKGGRATFEVYDPGTGFSRLEASTVPAEPITSVLGRRAAIRLDYTIHKGDRPESYSVYATKSRPRVMLREDMPGGLVSVLVAIAD
jgi:hypothetical protein